MKYIKQLSRGHLPALGLFILVTLVITWPYPAQIQTSLYNWSDSLLNSWTLAWGTHALLTDPFNLYNANIFYPYPNSLAYSESLVPQAFVAMPVILVTNMPAFAHNLLALASFVLAGFGMYLLAFDLTRSRAGGIVAGMIFGFTSYKMMHFAHLQLLSSQWMPLALLYLHKLLRPNPAGNRMDRINRINSSFRGRILLIIPERDRIKQAFLFAMFFALQALSSFYYAFFIAIAATCYVAYVTVVAVIRNSKFRIRNSELPITNYQLRFTNYVLRFTPLLLSFLLIALFTIPLALPYFSVQRDLGLERGVQDAEYYAANVRTYLTVPNGNWLYGKWLAPAARLTGSGERDFVGVVAIVLGIVGLVAGPKRNANKWFYLLLGIVGVILSFGARNEILLFPKWPVIHLPFYLPYRYLFLWVPGFKAMRGPDRFAYLAILALAVIAAYGVRFIVDKIRARRPSLSFAPALLGLALVVVIGAENIIIPVRATNPATLAKPVPDFAQFLAQGDQNSAVLELPMTLDNESLTWPQYYSIYHWRKLVNGFSGFFPPSYAPMVKLSTEFPSEASLAVLSEIGVGDVVVHNDLLMPGERDMLKARVAMFANRVQLVHHLGNDDVYHLANGGKAWAAELAAHVPKGSGIWLINGNPDDRLLFEYAAAFLSGRMLFGEPDTAFRTLIPPGRHIPSTYILINASNSLSADYGPPIWENQWLSLYERPVGE